MSDYSVDFSQKIRDKNIDSIGYGEVSADLKKLSQKTSSILKFEEIELEPFPKNSSIKVKEELEHIKKQQQAIPHWHTGDYKKKIDKDDDISFCFRSPIGCTYLNEEDVAKTGKRKSAMDEEGKCPDGENWICLECKAIRCSRYVNGHCEDHWKNTKCDEISTMKQDESEAMGHCIALSLQDLSVWCYECNSYLVHDDLELIVNKF